MTRSSALPVSSRHGGFGRFLPHWVPMLFIGGFLVVIGVNATLIIFAQRSFSGLETASPYERGLDYNRTLAADTAQKALGWQYHATISNAIGGTRTLEVTLADRDGHALDGLVLEAFLVRPSNDGLDLAIVPQPAGAGRYVTTFALPAPGQWELRVIAKGAGQVWQHSERLFVK